ncbi:MAG: arsenate reductase ArsC [Phreatobacter sp.]|uniref:arsenate-mycothiol transferase ArsC n=1 Tax=Phreatobacter sp. TaxID=1966341 RepID=UPI001A430BB1|nr:arsenate reductase ArsC [Phreatobacter sp.]MBL8570411.1 arsenate reductase ArsC [Phreatobacter sp.]
MVSDRRRNPQAVLFACTMNQVRSPMAAAIMKHFFGNRVFIESAGVHKGEHDPFVDAVMDEIGIDTQKTRPKTIEELEEWEGLNFDLVVTLAPDAHHKALDLTRTLDMDVEYWPTPDPTTAQGSREQVLDAYRQVRDMLMQRIRQRFPKTAMGNE